MNKVAGSNPAPDLNQRPRTTMSLAHARRAEIRSPFHVGSGDLGSRIGFGGVGIPPYRVLDTSGLDLWPDLWSEVCRCLSTSAYPPRGHGNLKAFYGDQEI